MRLFIFLLSLCLGIASCDVAKNVAAAALCGTGHAKGKMTLGLNLDFPGFGLRAGEVISNEGLQSFINDNLGSDLLNVKSIESVTEGDKFRFMEFDGALSEGFGVATGLFKDAFGGTGLTAENPFSFIGESFNVAAAFVSVGDRHADQWAYSQTQYDEAIDLYNALVPQAPDPGTGPVVVAVLDTGVDLEHPDLVDILVDGYNALKPGKSVQDENGHGTHCAGIIAGQAQQEEGVLGVASMAEVRIAPVQVLGEDGAGGFDAIEKGIRWATQQGVDVISLSLGAGLEYSDLDKDSQRLNNAVINEAVEAGILVVIAAGNESCPLGGECSGSGIFAKNFDEYTVVPCSYQGAICIGATSADETLASYSNFSSEKSASYRTQPDVSAPGTAIYSTWPRALGQDYNTISGTSMATPYVAGIGAVLKSLDRELNQEEFRQILLDGMAKPSDVVSKSGSGRVDLYATLVAFANDRQIGNPVPDKITPDPQEVDAPETGGGNDGDNLVASLFSAVCQ